MARQGISLRPDPRAITERNIRTLARAAIAIAHAAFEPRSKPTQIAERMWPDDDAVPLIVRGEAIPASLTNATALAATIVTDLLVTLGPTSVAAQLLAQGLQTKFGRAGVVSVPGLVMDGSGVSFVGEGLPAPVRQLTSTRVQLQPHKLTSTVVLSSEMVMSSSAEQIMRDALTRTTGLGLDRLLFDSNPADATRPAGLRYGITALTASTNTDMQEAMYEDFEALLSAVALIGGPIVLIAAPARAVTMQIRTYGELSYPILPCAALAANDVIAVAAHGLVSATSETPQFSTVREAAVHMDDAPAAIAPPGGPISAPVRSLWQTDTIGLQFKFGITWGLRDARVLAWLTTKWKVVA
jgi:hypothetical protein